MLNPSQLNEKINRLYLELEIIFKNDEQIKKCLKELVDYGKELSSFAPDYDCRPDNPANGYRTLLDMGIKLLEYGIKNGPSDQYNDLLTKFSAGINHIKSIREAKSDSQDLIIELFLKYVNREDVMGIRFMNIGQFYYSTRVSFTLRLLNLLISVYCADSMISGFKNLFSSDNRKKTLITLLKGIELPKVKPMVDMLYRMNQPVNFLVHGFKPSIRRVVKVQRQIRYRVIIDRENIPGIIDTNRRGLSSDKIKCKLFLQPEKSEVPSCHTIMIYISGGGCAYELNNDIFLRYISKKIKGLSVLEVIYTKSIDGKFPIQIQEILDVYLTLNRSDKTFQELLGFGSPSNIILAGDSGGAALAMSTLIALNDIRKRWPETNIRLPDAFYAFYPAFTFSPSDIFPSYLMGPFVPLLNPILLASFAEVISQPPNISQDEKQATHICQKTKQQLTDLLNERKNISESPYLSPLKYDHFDDLKDVHLFITACSQDVILDHSVEMAKRWRGKVTLDVMDHLPHMFLALILVNEARDALDLAIERILQFIK